MITDAPLANSHTTALVPIEVWAYQSPRLLADQIRLDIGLLAEALIYYDRVIAVPASNASVGVVLDDAASAAEHPLEPPARPKFVDCVDWFVSRGHFDNFLSLVEEGTLGFYHYGFQTLPILAGGVYSLVNAQDEEEAAGPVFERRILGSRSLEEVVPRARQRERLYRALRGQVTEVRAEEFGPAIENAVSDFRSSLHAGLAVQALVDELHDLVGWRVPPEVAATITGTGTPQTTLHWNVDLRPLGAVLGRPGYFNPGLILCGLAESNRTLWSAARDGHDLYLAAPVSALLGTKLHEADQRLTRSQQTIGDLQVEVEFPNVRSLVNEGALDFGDVIRLRARAGRFREWLQRESERDRDALVAYHHEVATAAGFTRGVRHAVRLFGAVGGAAVGAALYPGPAGAALGAGLGYVADIAAKLNEKWRPVVFGDWARSFVERRLRS